MRLVSIDDEAEQNFVTSQFGGQFAYPWLGAKKRTYTYSLYGPSLGIDAWKWSWTNNMNSPDSAAWAWIAGSVQDGWFWAWIGGSWPGLVDLGHVW